jgi:hypothetical protein
MKKAFTFILLFFGCCSLFSGVRYVSSAEMNRLIEKKMGKDHYAKQHQGHKKIAIGDCTVDVPRTGRSYKFDLVTEQECAKITESVLYVVEDMKKHGLCSVKIVKK